MKRSVAMMACVLSGALMISAYSPVVFAETTEKTEASKTDEAKDESEKKEDTSKVEVLEDGTYSAEFDTEFDVALIGKKNKWYDHKVKVTNPQKEADAEASDTKETDAKKVTAEDLKLEDGDYTAEVKMEGGSGKASVTSPTGFTVKDGKVTASVEWSSPYYDYMLIGDEKYEPVNKDGNSVFEIPVDGFDYPMEVVADTVAMSTPHEIEYTLQFDSASIKEAEK